MRAIRVPLNVDAQFRLAVGPVLLPVRSLVLAASVSPLAYLLLTLQLPGLWGAAGAGFLLAMAGSFGLPERQGVWIGTHLAYRHAWRVLPSTVARGTPGYALARDVDGSIHVSRERAANHTGRWMPRRWRPFASVPSTWSDAPGLLRLEPGGHRAVLVLDGPPVSLSSEAYLDWCRSVIDWVGTLECPVQFLTLMSHHDADRVGEAFDRRVTRWPRTPLRQLEHAIVSRRRRHPSPLHALAGVTCAHGEDGGRRTRSAVGDANRDGLRHRRSRSGS